MFRFSFSVSGQETLVSPSPAQLLAALKTAGLPDEDASRAVLAFKDFRELQPRRALGHGVSIAMKKVQGRRVYVIRWERSVHKEA